MSGYRPAPAARFDQASQHRRALMAKAHLSAKELGQTPDDRRAILFRVTGRASLKDASDAEIVSFLDEQKRLGWQAKPKARVADHPGARKARALWVSLWQLGAIADPSERALEAFAARQLGSGPMQWADQGKMFKLIEALVAIAARNGWDAKSKAAPDPLVALKRVKIALLEAILVKLKAEGLAAQDWILEVAAERIAGTEAARTRVAMAWALGEIDAVAAAFGNLLRDGQRSHSA